MKKCLLLVVTVLFVSMNWADMPAMGADPILVGVPTSLTAIEGKESLNCVMMAVDEINAKGGVKVGDVKRPIKIETIDIRDASPGVRVPEALLGIEKIITEKKVKALLIGPFRSEALMAGMELIAKYKVPMLGTIAMTPKSEGLIKKDPGKYKYVFRVCLNGKYLVGYLVQTAAYMKKAFGFKKIFFMHQDVLWAKAVANITGKVVTKKLGYEVVGTEAYPTGSKDFSAGLAKVKAKGTHVLMLIFDMPESGILVKQWHGMKIPAFVSGFASPMAGPGAWDRFEKKIGGAINLNFEIGSGIPAAKYAPAKEFYDKYAKKYGKPIEAGHGPAPSYDAVYILAEAIERAGSVDADKVVAELEKTDRKGAIGRIKFDEGHQAVFGDDPTKTAVGAVAQWSDKGKRTIILPKSIAEGEIQLPAWMKKK